MGPCLPRYMAEAVWLQRVVKPDWVPEQNPPIAVCPPASGSPVPRAPESDLHPQPVGPFQPGKGPPGSGEAAVLQELHPSLVPPLLRESPRRASPLRTRRCQEPLHGSLSS